jgi:DNA modification methylase
MLPKAEFDFEQIAQRFEENRGNICINFREICGSFPKEYYTNLIHPYPAKMLNNIPLVLLPFYAEKGETVLDCFCGSGTILMQARLYGMNAIGVDINPLSRLISKVKATTVNINKLEKERDKLFDLIENTAETEIPDFPNRDFWFEKDVQKDLGHILNCIKEVKNIKYRDFFKVCFSSIIRKVSNADPKIVPPVKSKKMRKLIEKGRTVDVIGTFKSAVDVNMQRLSKFCRDCDKSSTLKVIQGDARNLTIEDLSVDLVITSPPYMSAQKYVRSTRLEMYWLGLGDQKKLQKIDMATVGTERTKVSEYQDISKIGIKLADKCIEKIKKKNLQRAYIVYKYFIDMEKTFKEIYRVLRPGKNFILVIGNNQVTKISIPNHKILTKIGRRIGFTLEKQYIDEIKSRGFMTKRNKTADIIDSEWVLIFRK